MPGFSFSQIDKMFAFFGDTGDAPRKKQFSVTVYQTRWWELELSVVY